MHNKIRAERETKEYQEKLKQSKEKENLTPEEKSNQTLGQKEVESIELSPTLSETGLEHMPSEEKIFEEEEQQTETELAPPRKVVCQGNELRADNNPADSERETHKEPLSITGGPIKSEQSSAENDTLLGISLRVLMDKNSSQELLRVEFEKIVQIYKDNQEKDVSEWDSQLFRFSSLVLTR